MEEVIPGINGLNQGTIFVDVPQLLIPVAHHEGVRVNDIFIACTHDGMPHRHITSVRAAAEPASDLLRTSIWPDLQRPHDGPSPDRDSPRENARVFGVASLHDAWQSPTRTL
jgi:hypothetical protein